MPAFRKIVFGSSIALVLAATFYEARLVARQREQLGALRARRTTLIRELDRARRQNGTDAAALADLQRQIEAARTGNAAEIDPAKAAANAATQAWLAKLATVKRLFAEHPEANIPELQLLNMRDWLLAVKNLQFDTEEHTRKGLAALRKAAKDLFTMQLGMALSKFINAHDGDLPPTVLAVAPYFASSIDPAIFQRYDMVRSGNARDLIPARGGAVSVIGEKNPIDEDYDSRAGATIGRMAPGYGSEWAASSGGLGIGPTAWIDGYDDRLKRALVDFTRDHPGSTPTGLSDVVSYMNPPLDAAVAEKLIQAEKARAK